METAVYRFRIIAGPESGRRFALGEKGALIGRSENCDVVMSDPSLSRHHCRIFLRDGLLWVADLKSSNGTEVDGVPVQEAPLWKDRRIAIGDTVILVESDTASPVPHATRRPAHNMALYALTVGLLLSVLAVGIAYHLRRRAPLHTAQTMPTVTIPPLQEEPPLWTAAEYDAFLAETETWSTLPAAHDDTSAPPENRQHLHPPNTQITTTNRVLIGYWPETNRTEIIELELGNGEILKISRGDALEIRALH